MVRLINSMINTELHVIPSSTICLNEFIQAVTRMFVSQVICFTTCHIIHYNISS